MDTVYNIDDAGDSNMLTDVLTSYITFCTDLCLKKRHVKSCTEIISPG